MMAEGGIPDPVPLHVHVCARKREQEEEKEKKGADYQNGLIMLMTSFLKHCGYCMSESEHWGLLLPAMGHVCVCS